MGTYDQTEAERILARHGEYLLEALRQQPVQEAVDALGDIHRWLDDRNE